MWILREDVEVEEVGSLCRGSLNLMRMTGYFERFGASAVQCWGSLGYKLKVGKVRLD